MGDPSHCKYTFIMDYNRSLETKIAWWGGLITNQQRQMELTHKVVTFAQHNTMHLYRNKRELATACSQRQNKHQKNL